MKRIGFLYEKICDIDNIQLAIRNSSKGKKDRWYVKKALEGPAIAYRVQKMLQDKTYKKYLGHNKTKIIYDSSSEKERVITVPKYLPDQIIHWAVIQVIQPTLMRGMYHWNCGSIPCRGGDRARRFVLKNQKKYKYCFKADIHHFFPSIQHDKLMQMLEKKIKDRDVLELLNHILVSGGDGLPIGYYTSQWLSNFYLQGFDHFVSSQQCVLAYCRYVDDIVIFGNNKRKLLHCKAEMDKYLSGIGLEIKSNWQIWKVGTRPISFVGFLFYVDCVHLRKKLFFRTNQCIRRISNRGMIVPLARRYISYYGWCKHTDFRKYYLNHIKPVAKIKVAKRCISRYEKSIHNS